MWTWTRQLPCAQGLAENDHLRGAGGPVKTAKNGAKAGTASANYNTEAFPTPDPRLPMAAAPAQDVPYVRHPLGLPPGSIRAVLALMIAGLFWLFLALPDSFPQEEKVPLFLYVLLAMVFLFFGSHGHTIGRHLTGQSPLYLPRGILRATLLIGSAALIGWLYYTNPERLTNRLTPDPKHLEQWPVLLISAFGGFTVGCVVRKGPWRQSAGFQDILATVSLLAMLGLVIETILVVFIKSTTVQTMDLSTWEAILTAVVAFYFGARS
jgi:hypothetical protein